jgi:hypothetical protein
MEKHPSHNAAGIKPIKANPSAKGNIILVKPFLVIISIASPIES